MKMNSALMVLLFIFISSHGITQTKNNMNNKDYSLEVIRYSIPKEQHNSFETAYTEAGKFLKASPYCQGYEVVHGNEEPDNYIVFIRWTSIKEHMEGFRKSSQFMPFFNLVKPYYNNIQEMKHYDITDNKWSRE
jgi:quinol monooxygenase YgiN